MQHTLPWSLVLLCVAPIGAQTWQQVATPTTPPGRAALGLATDVAANTVVMFGGTSNGSYVGDTWRFDGADWSPVTGPGPAARARHAMAFDRARGAAVLFGGINGVGINNWFNDTWTFAAGAWQLRTTTNHPLVRFGHALADDPVRGRVVMFGGRTRSGTIFLGDTWEWDGTDWLPQTPLHAPSPRMDHVLAWDPAGGRVLLFGGIPLGGPVAGDTWAWNGTDWTQLQPLHSPSPRMQAAAATDLARNRVVLHGGYDGASLFDTWEWDGADWHAVATTTWPAAEVLPALTTGPTGANVVLFGGEDAGGAALAATWRFGELPAVRAIGSGCGPGPLTLAADGGSEPAIGRTFTSAMAPVPTGGVPFQSLGFSDQQRGGVPLPIDLSPLGMTGCALLHDAAALFLPCTLTGSVARHALALPNNARFVGVEIFLQGYAIAPGVNPFGVVASNALGLRIGRS